MTTQKKIVLLDTSYYRSRAKDLDKIYPADQYIRCLDASSLLELSDIYESDGSLKADAHVRESSYQQYEARNLRIILNTGQIMIYEHENIKLPSFPFISREEEKDLKIHIAGKGRNYKQIEAQRKKALEEEQMAVNDLWNNVITISNQNCSISLEDIEKKKEQIYLTQSFLPFISQTQQRKRQSIAQLIFDSGFKTLHPALSNLNVDCMKDREKFYLPGMQYLKSNCPAINAHFTFYSLLFLLTRRHEDKQITPTIAGTQIKIDKNSLTDIKIGLGALPYVNLFETLDKHQANLLRILLPEHTGKIVNNFK